MKKLLSLILALALSLALAACGGDTPEHDAPAASSASTASSSASGDESESPEEPAVKEEESQDADEVITISGSHAGIVMNSLEKNFAFPIPPANTEEDTTTWSAISDDHKYSYLMTGKISGSEISYAQFDALRDDSNAFSYLSYCATVPYEGSDAKAAQAFIAANLEGDELATTTIGGADFYLRPIGMGSQLIIVPAGVDP